MQKRTVAAFVNRGIRRVPLTWQHPCDATGEPIPLSERRLLTDDRVAARTTQGAEASGLAVDAGSMPDFSHVPTDQMGIQAYETTTEGTPISPVFPDTPEGRFAVVQYCADHETVFGPYTATVTEWATILFGTDTVAVNLDTGTIEALAEPAQRH